MRSIMTIESLSATKEFSQDDNHAISWPSLSSDVDLTHRGP
jgi:hypothetical protein